mmetsp:Transcript_102175/g.327680  ORF Transcript_102175/g.327680 Transcript_102175/m.327680 type:complete len:233 (+) Transcript_102175:706-1404(+)
MSRRAAGDSSPVPAAPSKRASVVSRTTTNSPGSPSRAPTPSRPAASARRSCTLDECRLKAKRQGPRTKTRTLLASSCSTTMARAARQPRARCARFAQASKSSRPRKRRPLASATSKGTRAAASLKPLPRRGKSSADKCPNSSPIHVREASPANVVARSLTTRSAAMPRPTASSPPRAVMPSRGSSSAPASVGNVAVAAEALAAAGAPTSPGGVRQRGAGQREKGAPSRPRAS